MSATLHRTEGWVLVPITPTTAMLDALHDAIGHDVQTGTCWDGPTPRHAEVSVLDIESLPRAYAAMLSALPPAPNQGEAS